MKKLILIFLIFIVSCGGEISSTPNIGGNGPINLYWAELPIGIIIDDEIQQDAIDLYNEVFGRQIFESTTNGVTIKFRELLIDNLLGLTKLFLDGDEIIRATITIDTSMLDSENNDLYECVLLHEFGHLLGFMRHYETGPLQNPVACPEDLTVLFNPDFIKMVNAKYEDILL